MKRAVYTNYKKQVLFLLVAPYDRTDGYMLSLPAVAQEALDSVEIAHKISRTLYGIHVDKDNFNTDNFVGANFIRDLLPCSYAVIPVFKQDNRESKYTYVWLNKQDIKNLRESNVQMLKDNYEIIEDVYKALI